MRFSVHSALLTVSAVFITAAAPTIKITELSASNKISAVNREFGDYPDWLELSCEGTDTILLSDFYLSDSRSDPLKYRLPSEKLAPGNFKVIYCDQKSAKFHAPFSLSSAGEYVSITHLSGTTADSVEYPAMPADVSYGKNPVSGRWGWYSIPSPMKMNSIFSARDSRDRAADVREYTAVGNGSASVSLSSSESGTIRWTNDGSDPTESSAVYTVPLFCTKNQIIRARLFAEGKMAGRVTVVPVILDSRRSLPIMNIASDSANLWDDSVGICTRGKNGLFKYASFPANYYQNWERPAYAEIRPAMDKPPVLSAECKLSVVGERRHMPQKSLKISSLSSGKSSPANGILFPNRPASELSELFVRNGGYPDYQYSMIRGALIHTAAAQKTSADYSAYRPVSLYLNGSYWGLYTLRERITPEYFAANHTVSSEITIEEYKSVPIFKSGDSTLFPALTATLNSLSADSDSGRAVFESLIDADNLIDYSAVQLFTANTDWPGNNQILWRENGPSGRWRWVLDDVDAAFGLWVGADHNTVSHALAANSTEWNNLPASTLFLRKLVENRNLRNRFCQRTAALASTAFDTLFIDHLVDSLSGEIEEEMPFHIARWSEITLGEMKWYPDGTVVSSMEKWREELNRLKVFNKERHKYFYHSIADQFGLEGVTELTVLSDDSAGGTFAVEGFSCGTVNRTITCFKGIPLHLKFHPAAGFHINGPDSLVITPTGSDTVRVSFVRGSGRILAGTLSGHTTLTASDNPAALIGTVTVPSGSSLKVEPGVQFICGENSSLKIEGRVTIAGSASEKVRFSSEEGRYWQGIFLNSCEDTAVIRHAVITSALGTAASGRPGMITAYSSSVVLDSCDLSAPRQPFFAEGGSLFARATLFSADATCDYVNVKRGKARIESCDFKGNRSPDTDGIDFDGVTDGEIVQCRFFNFSGSNSDAVDIGEGSQNIRISRCIMSDITDKAVSVGQGSSAEIRGIIAVRCGLGIGTKDGRSQADVSNCTFFETETAIASYEKNFPVGGGTISVSNSIVTRSKEADFLCDTVANVQFSYCSSDRTRLPGTGSVLTVPQFGAEGREPWTPESGSPCINGGDPQSPLDPDGSRADIGAHVLFYSLPSEPSLKSGTAAPYRIVQTGREIQCHIQISAGSVSPSAELYDFRGRQLASVPFAKTENSTGTAVIDTRQIALSPVILVIRTGTGTHCIKLSL